MSHRLKATITNSTIRKHMQAITPSSNSRETSRVLTTTMASSNSREISRVLTIITSTRTTMISLDTIGNSKISSNHTRKWLRHKRSMNLLLETLVRMKSVHLKEEQVVEVISPLSSNLRVPILTPKKTLHSLDSELKKIFKFPKNKREGSRKSIPNESDERRP